MADRFWVGGTANWDGTAGTKWAAISGGAGGESVPTSADDVYFDANSGAVTVTVSISASCKNLDFSGFTGTFQGVNQSVTIYGNLILGASATYTSNIAIFFAGTASSTITCNGKSLSGAVTFNGTGIWTLADAFAAASSITVVRGTFDTNNYNVTASSLSSSNSNTRTINLGSSTVTLSTASGAVNFALQIGLTFNAGTSTISMSSGGATLVVGTGVTFYDVSWTSTAITTPSIQGANTFNNLSVAGRASAGVANFRINADQTINGTLTLSAGTNATMRTFVRSDTIGTTRTLTCAAVASLTDIDFRDITIAGAAAPVSGTRLGDCKGNSGITFDAPKTVYWRNATNANWGATTWSATDGGTADVTQFPLAQDTAIFPSGYPNSGVTVTVNASYNIGTIDMSARTSNTMTLTCLQFPSIYGDWINGTGTTIGGIGTLTFAGRGSQTITSAGRTFTQRVAIESPSGSVTFQDAFTCNRTATPLVLSAGTLECNGYNVTLTAGSFNTGFSNVRELRIGSGVFTVAGSGTTAFNANPSTNLTVTGTGTISLTSASAKTFVGGDIQTYPTLNQGGTGALTVTGSNKFQGLTNTAIGSVLFTGGTTNEFTSFVLNGASGTPLTLGSTSTAPVTLKKTGAWNVGANSTDGGNNTGLSFTAGDMDYLSISYVTGEVLTPTGTFNIYFGSTNIQDIYYGSSPVSAIYYGSTLVFQK